MIVPWYQTKFNSSCLQRIESLAICIVCYVILVTYERIQTMHELCISETYNISNSFLCIQRNGIITNHIYFAGTPVEHFRFVSLFVLFGHLEVRRLLSVSHSFPDFAASSADFRDADRVHREFALVLLATMLREEDESRTTAFRPVDVFHHDSEGW